MNTVKVKYKNIYIENIVPGTTLYEISKCAEKDFTFPIIGAKLNNLSVDLNTTVLEDCEVEFFDRSSNEGNRIYGRTLEFMIIVIAKNFLSRKTDVHINYSLDNGIYCEVVGHKVDEKEIANFEAAMKELVKAKLPITKSKVSRLDAIKYFEAGRQFDKVKNLNYNSNSTVDLYRLSDIYDYFFGPLAYDTSQVSRFKINYLGDNSFIICYPSVKSPAFITKYTHHEMILDTDRQYQKWGKLINIDMVSDLNEIGSAGNYGDAIRLFETHYENQLSEVAEKIYQKRKDIKLVLLSGPSSSGKTTTAKKLSLYLRAKGLKPHQISLDDYYMDKRKTPKDEDGNYDFASIKATDVSLFNDHLKKLLKGEEVGIPTYDFIKGKKIYEDKYLKLGTDDILVIEGIHTLNDALTKSVDKKNKYKIFVTPIIQLKIDNHNRIRTTDLRKIRRIVRDSRFRGWSAEDTLKIWHNVDKESYQNVYPYEDDADFVINSSLSYEMGVLRIYAEPLLYAIKPDSEVYDEAIRLINILRQFLPISSEEVPKDSILREFIGEGVFN